MRVNTDAVTFLKGTSMKKYIDTIKDKITVDDLDEKYQEIASIIGVSNYMSLCEEFGGTRIFLPKIKNLTKKYIYKKVIELKDVMSKDQLSRMFDLCSTTVYKIINEYEDRH